MRDGVNIAIDLTRPDVTNPIPTILRLTRYHRRMKVRRPLRNPKIQSELDQHFDNRNFFVNHGYAWVDVCVRGSGASGGKRISPWSQDEIEDSREIIDWIISQSWSDGNVGARGISYDGTAAECLITLSHPALKAIAPRFALFDVYEDIAFPGGIPLTGFTKHWSAFNSALDRNRFDEVMALLLQLSKPAREQLAKSPFKNKGDKFAAMGLAQSKLVSTLLSKLVLGVAPVDADPDSKILKKHIDSRTDNMDVHKAAKGMVFRDQPGMIPERPDDTIDNFSPHLFVDKYDTVPAIFNYGGWFDSAYARSAIKRYLSYEDRDGTRLIIGPWKHGVDQNISVWNKNRTSEFDHEGELLSFFDEHLKGKIEESHKVKYFTISEEKWNTSSTWPPEGFETQRRYLAKGGNLGLESEKASLPLSVQGKHHSGKAGRWSCLLPILSLTHYLPQSSENLLSFNSPALENDIEMTGHPIVHFEFTSTSSDPRIFVYLEDLTPSGEIHYVTEGQFRAIHRKEKKIKPKSHQYFPFHSFKKKDQKSTGPGTKIIMEFDLLPLSYLFKKGHSLRICISGCDTQNFEIGPQGIHTIDLEKTWFDFPINIRD